MTQDVQLPQITVNAKTIQSCFSDCLYEVPEFQRPFAWENDQLEDYWEDVALAKGDLFFGTIVTWISKRHELFRDVYSLIDGQQRLTTSTIALSVIRDALAILASEVVDGDTEGPSVATRARTLMDNSQKYLVVSDDYGEAFPVVSRKEEMFYHHIQKPDAIPSGAKWDESARRVGEARKFFERKITQLIEEEPSSDKLEAVTRIRNNILRARLIQVELEKEEDAFLIFETLNTRGAELQLRDLIKNALVRGGGADSQDRKAIEGRWNALMATVVPEGASGDEADSFIWQSWNSRRSAVRRSELYKQLLPLLGASPATHVSYLVELEQDAAVYKFLEAGNTTFPDPVQGKRIALSVSEVQDSISALNIFNVSVANSALTALVRKYDSSPILSRKYLIKAFRAIENFHFQFSQLASSSSTGGTRKRYNAFAVQLENATTRGEVNSSIDTLVDRLRESLPDGDISRRAFTRLIYAPKLKLTRGQQKRGRQDLIRYVLLNLARHGKTVQSSRRAGDWTIEHIRPQAERRSERAEDPVFSIGNLALLTKQANEELANLPFTQKRDRLLRYSALKDDALMGWLGDDETSDVSDERISERASALANWALDSVWTV